MNNPICDKTLAETTNLLQLWHQQVKQHHLETFRGIGIQKFPQDLWTYEKILWEVKPTVVFEIGVNNGGFTLWLADRLRSIQLYQIDAFRKRVSSKNPPRVVGVDIDILKAQVNIKQHVDLMPYICLEEADASDTTSLEFAASIHISEDERVLIIEDSAHIYETTINTLTALAPFVSFGSYFIVEDGCVDYEHLRESEQWPRGVTKAISEFLASHREFIQDPIGDSYTITCHPGGFLRRID